MEIKTATRSVLKANAQAFVDAKNEVDIDNLANEIGEEIERASNPRTDRAAYLIVITALSLVVLAVVVIYGIWTATPLDAEGNATRSDIPDALIAIGSAAVGALAGLLTPAGPKR